MATARKGRPKGYASWNPRPETRAVLDDVRAVLREYDAYLPLTVRQIFYRLVGQYGFEKTEAAYERLGGYLVRARRAQMIDFDVIRDDGTVHNEYLRFTSPEDFWRNVEENAEHYQRDKLAEQPVHIEFWCEAAGMVPQLERVANYYSVPVFSTGGFSSVTVTNEIANRALKRDKPTVFLHVGDFDPSGESIFDAMTVDAEQFFYNRLVWRLEKENPKLVEEHWAPRALYPKDGVPAGLPDLRPRRVALTGDQVEEYDLPTVPPKASDTRSVNWFDETCQLEALPPDTLAQLIEDAIEDELDPDVLQRTRDEEHTERGAIKRRVQAILEGEQHG